MEIPKDLQPDITTWNEIIDAIVSNMSVIFIERASFGKRGSVIAYQPLLYRTPLSAKMKVIESSINLWWPISSDFKLETTITLCTALHWYI